MSKILGWNEVIQDENFQKLPLAEQFAAKQEYFDSVVLPQLNPKIHDSEAAYAEFMSQDDGIPGGSKGLERLQNKMNNSVQPRLSNYSSEENTPPQINKWDSWMLGLAMGQGGNVGDAAKEILTRRERYNENQAQMRFLLKKQQEDNQAEQVKMLMQKQLETEKFLMEKKYETQKMIQEKTFDYESKMMEKKFELLGKDHIPNKMKLDNWNSLVPVMKKYGFEVEPLSVWPDNASKHLKNAAKIMSDPKLKFEEKIQGLRGTMAEYINEGNQTTEDEYKNLTDMQKQLMEQERINQEQKRIKLAEININKEKDKSEWIQEGSTSEGLPIYRNKYMQPNDPKAYTIGNLESTGGELYPKIQNPAGQMTEGMAHLRTLKSTMQTVLTDINNPKNYNKFRENVGFFKGRANQLASQFKDVDPQLGAMYADLAHSFELVYVLSGKQVSDKEIDRYKPFLPDPNMPMGTLKQRLESLNKYIALREENMIGVSRQSGRPFRESNSSVVKPKNDPLGLFK